MSFDRILPNSFVFARLPSARTQLIRVTPNSDISIPKIGTFPANDLLHRPYHLTFDVLEKPEPHLRIVSREECTRDFLGQAEEEEAELEDDLEATEEGAAQSPTNKDAQSGSIPGSVPEEVKTNRTTVDDPNSQRLTAEEILKLKQEHGEDAGKKIIETILSNHAELHKKTTFSLHKYTIRKRNKYLKRFTVEPVDIPGLLSHITEEKDAAKILELKHETLALMLNLANVRYGGRYLVVDDTSGFVTGAIAERLNILHPEPESEISTEDEPEEAQVVQEANVKEEEETIEGSSGLPDKNKKRRQPSKPTGLAVSNTITLVHPNEQPNLSLLKYFSYDVAGHTTPINHPLTNHLKSISYLQLLHPDLEPTLAPPKTLSDEALRALKGGKRSAYYKKWRRFERMTEIVKETREGGFDSLIICSSMWRDLEGLLRVLVPLLRGSAEVVIFSPSREPLVQLAERYSSARRSEWVQRSDEENAKRLEEDELDPTLLLAPTIHTVAERRFQFLPGRTHPLMTSRGGAEGYIFHATRVLPAEGKVSGRGIFLGRKKRKVEATEAEADGTDVVVGTEDVDMAE
ncbi:Gcd10p-domain-containing protein [Ascobolus immersus RN42]|uniref:tRNA (adenine(58)-N(1))-methyltransferase non-catalytic subunit TRM6 n=1 Tax=Ascobolus immersus RN42 TaxID=1160509 RepID=A0A3N4HK37_ASCIM|nr:Gcd10p-domain-containing protein [Ascobolus immersus RN42]